MIVTARAPRVTLSRPIVFRKLVCFFRAVHLCLQNRDFPALLMVRTPHPQVGNLCWLAGQIGLVPETMMLIDGGAIPQTEQVIGLVIYESSVNMRLPAREFVMNLSSPGSHLLPF